MAATAKPTRTAWVAFCPSSDVCKRGGRRLGSFWTEQEAREKVYHHLTASTLHSMGAEEATAQADNAMLDTEEAETEEATGGEQGKQEQGKYGKYEQGKYEQGKWSKDDWSRPYAQGKGKGKHGGKPAEDAAAKMMNVIADVMKTAAGGSGALTFAHPSRPNRMEDVITSIARSEAAARTAARMAHAAANAFEQEASVLHGAMESIRSYGF